MSDELMTSIKKLITQLENDRALPRDFKFFCNSRDQYDFLLQSGIHESLLEFVEPIPTESIPMIIGDIGNYYGELWIKQENDKYYWGIENWNGTCWREIPKYLFDTLLKFESEREQ